ncbi:MAG: hypothetical protein B7Z80_05085 [Rhodospirillales bacterium 20-64-7]|nr:MAG: hypothetical protein B7Z80_05085 [Rhodospirillales bacterium 20-64-7]HQT77110.1 sulfotransferase family 2 domain-containing protein [Rhodopila sp.]
MLTGQYRRIYYYHLKKCGGSTLNQWLDTLTFDGRHDNPQWMGSWLFGEPEVETRAEEAAREKASARAVFQRTDIVHSHAPLRPYVPARTFSFTMLREPVARLVSQTLDWRRLQPHDTIDNPAHVRACVEDCRRLPLRDFLLRHAFDDGRMFLNNYLTRALAAGRIGRLAIDVVDAARLLDIALQSLELDYDFIGLTEQHDLCRNVVCSMVGLPAARTVPVVNDSLPAEKSAHDVQEAADVLQALTGADQVLYERACTLFARRHQAAGLAYDDAAFEAKHATALLSELRGRYDRCSTRFSVRDPLIGAGFHGRDGAGTADCAVWTGPDCRATLYFPTPPDMPVSVLVWIRGYAAPWQREQLRVWINGKPVAHRFEQEPGYADLLVTDAYAEGEFTRLDLAVNETVGSGTAGTDLYDPRKRGIAFDGYGWR